MFSHYSRFYGKIKSLYDIAVGDRLANMVPYNQFGLLAALIMLVYRNLLQCQMRVFRTTQEAQTTHDPHQCHQKQRNKTHQKLENMPNITPQNYWVIGRALLPMKVRLRSRRASPTRSV